MAPLLHTEHLSRRFPGNRGVADISLSLDAGDIVGLAGLNGAGKSTTLAMLAGILLPSEGRVVVEGRDLRTDVDARRLLGFAPDQPPLYPELTVRELVDYSAALHGLNGGAAKKAVSRVLADCELTDAAPRVIRGLSRGYRQRVGLAQALVHRPPVLLLDEPTEGLDPRQSARFRELVADHAQVGAVLLSTHQMEVIAGLCNRIVILHDGRTVLERNLDGESAARLHGLFAAATGEEAQ